MPERVCELAGGLEAGLDVGHAAVDLLLRQDPVVDHLARQGRCPPFVVAEALIGVVAQALDRAPVLVCRNDPLGADDGSQSVDLLFPVCQIVVVPLDRSVGQAANVMGSSHRKPHPRVEMRRLSRLRKVNHGRAGPRKFDARPAGCKCRLLPPAGMLASRARPLFLWCSGAKWPAESAQALMIVNATDLTQRTASLFEGAGVPAEDALITAEVLVRTNLRGVDTHGVARVLAYVEKLISGEMKAVPNPSVEWRDGVLHYDGDGGLGQVVATRAVAAAMERARDQAVVTAVIRGSGHLGALGMFLLKPAEAGLIAFLCQETQPLMALAGAREPAIGNNPLAFAVPVRSRPPLVFDMATSVVARGNVLQAVRDKARTIPADWAIGPDGLPTNDPQMALKGAMLPIAGHKGIGLAMLVQVLAGSLTASATAASAALHAPVSAAGNVSAMLMLFNPDLFVGRAAFDDHVAGWLDTYLGATGPGARYPGERAADCEQQRLREGIPLPASVVTELVKAGALVGRPFPVA